MRGQYPASRQGWTHQVGWADERLEARSSLSRVGRGADREAGRLPSLTFAPEQDLRPLLQALSASSPIAGCSEIAEASRSLPAGRPGTPPPGPRAVSIRVGPGEGALGVSRRAGLQVARRRSWSTAPDGDRNAQVDQHRVQVRKHRREVEFVAPPLGQDRLAPQAHGEVRAQLQGEADQRPSPPGLRRLRATPDPGCRCSATKVAAASDDPPPRPAAMGRRLSRVEVEHAGRRTRTSPQARVACAGHQIVALGRGALREVALRWKSPSPVSPIRMPDDSPADCQLKGLRLRKQGDSRPRL